MALTRKYETVIILKPSLSEEEIAAQVEKYKNLIAEHGTVENVDEWGKRKLAYEIDDETDGYYVQYNYTAPTDFPAEFDRLLNISDVVMRSLIVEQGK
ncbi:30S ribosomal protein S6 [[Clostridium] cellulosi]